MKAGKDTKEKLPPIRSLPDTERVTITSEVVERLKHRGLHEAAEVARRYVKT